MLSNIQKILTNNMSAAVALFIAMLIPVAFNNCSNQFAFEASEESRLASLNSSGTIVINNGDEFASSPNVALSISHISADRMYVTNDPTCETGGTWENVTPNKLWTLGTRNTSSAVYVKFTNDGALASDCLSDTIVHDDIAPTLTVATPAPAYTNASDVRVGLLSQDSGSGIDRAICAATSSTAASECSPSSLAITSLPEGVHGYNVSVRDRAGNSSAPQNVSFAVDRTAPSMSLNLTPSLTSNQTTAVFQFSGSDAVSGIDRFECRIGSLATVASQAFGPCVSGVSRVLASGAQRFEGRAVDRAGNVSSVVPYNWTIDTGAPTVTITLFPKPYSNQTQATFGFVGTDDSGPISSFTCQIDGGAKVACSSPFTTVANLSQGTHTFTVVGADGVGNQSSPTSYSWTVDTTPPVVTISSKPANITNLKNANFAISATDSSGIDLIECQLDGDGFKACGTTSNHAGLLDGNHKFEVRAKDRAGNVSAVASHTWAIDTTKPSVQLVSGPARWIGVRAATVSVAVVDTNAAVGLPAPTLSCRLNSEPFASCTASKTYSGLIEQGHVYYAQATDAAGNTSDTLVHTFGVDLTPPAINFGKQPLSLVDTAAIAEVAFEVTDAGSGTKSVTCGLNGTLAPCTAAYTNSFANLPAGEYRFVVVAKDNVDNESRGEVVWQVANRIRNVTSDINVTGSNKLDVLVVIDNSGSMSNEHKNMAARFGTFLDQLNGTDWQVGIITTDVSSDAIKKDGRLVEFRESSTVATGQYIIKSSMGLAAAKQWFAATIQMPTNGSASEQGVAASLRALQRSQQSGNAVSAPNAALFRSDAALAILVVTDADETNPQGTLAQNRPETLINFVKTTWPSKVLSFHSIVVPIGDTVCRSSDGNEGYGYNYVSLSNLTGGIIGTVCAADYGAQLTKIGVSSQELILSAPLECQPVDSNSDGKLDVTVMTADGSAVPSYTVEGLKVRFASALPVGKTTLKYSCVVL